MPLYILNGDITKMLSAVNSFEPKTAIKIEPLFDTFFSVNKYHIRFLSST